MRSSIFLVLTTIFLTQNSFALVKFKNDTLYVATVKLTGTKGSTKEPFSVTHELQPLEEITTDLTDFEYQNLMIDFADKEGLLVVESFNSDKGKLNLYENDTFKNYGYFFRPLITEPNQGWTSWIPQFMRRIESDFAIDLHGFEKDGTISNALISIWDHWKVKHEPKTDM